MASVAKLSRDRRKKGASYYIQFIDHKGKRRTTKGCPDKGVSEAKAAKIETVVQRLKLGLAPETELEALLGRDTSDSWSTQLEKFKASLTRKDTTPKHVKLTINRINLVLDGCSFETLADFDSDQAEEFLSQYCQTKDLGHRTYNHYLQAIDSFGNWLAHPKRRLLERNPFAGIPRRNAATDVRHPRRALLPEEIAKLIDTARQSPRQVQCYDGITRARIYLLSYMTGLRKGEIASLTPASFNLDGVQPTLTVEAKDSKRRRKDTLPLHVDLVREIRGWLKGLSAHESLFPKLAKRKTYKMVQRDLEDAGIPYKTEEGIADFHAAGRHTHITSLLRNGVSLAEARELARHSDVRMTMRYTHIGLDDQAKAVNQLPAFPASKKKASKKCLHNVCTEGGADGQAKTRPDIGRHQNDEKKKRRNPNDNKGFGVDKHRMTVDDPNCQKVEAAGIEPASRGIST